MTLLQPFINHSFNSAIWRLEIDEVTGIMALELRDQQDKRVSFAAVSLLNGEVLFESYVTPERWLAGIETIHRGMLLIHHYKHESGPEHKAVLAVDANSGTLQWSNYSLAFDHLTTNGPVVYNANIQPVKLMLADIATGTLLRSFDKITDKPLENKIVVPDIIPAAALKGFDAGFVPYGNIVHYLNHNNYRIVSLHSFESGVLQQHIFVLKEAAVLHHDLLNTGIQKLQPEAFVLHQNALIYIKNRAQLKVLNL